jgi:predicted exporter
VRTFFNLPIFQTIALLSAAHALLCVALAGVDGLREVGIFAISGVASAFLSKATTLKSHWAWFRSYSGQFHIWAFCTAAMTLFVAYRSAPRFDVALAEALSAAAFFMAMVCLGNRVLK